MCLRHEEEEEEEEDDEQPKQMASWKAFGFHYDVRFSFIDASWDERWTKASVFAEQEALVDSSCAQ
jgi:hypothetical protein